MQLSLRTLLAFADDIYDPKSRQQVMQHIKENPTASAAFQKIVDVVNSNTITPPGNEFDPNLVAAYLDHLLSDDEVRRFEILVCKSEVCLAEVASVHHLLNVVFGHPATISPTLRQQLYRIATIKSHSSPDQPPVRQNQPSESLQLHVRKERFHDRQRPHLGELLSSCQRRKNTRLWGISLFCIVLFVAVFYLNIMFESSPPEQMQPKSTLVSIESLEPKIGNSEYFQDNHAWANPPQTHSFPPTNENVWPTQDNAIVHVAAAPSLPIDNQINAINPLPQPTEESFPLPQNPEFQSPSELPPSQFPTLTAGHFDIYDTLSVLESPQPALQTSWLIENRPKDHDFDLSLDASLDERMNISHDSYEMVPEKPNFSSDVVSFNQDSHHGSLMQISSVSHSPEPQVIQQSNISLDETQPVADNKMDVKDFGNAPSLNDIINRPLPPLVPNQEKEKAKDAHKSELSSDDENTGRDITPVSFQKRNAVFAEKMKITTLELPKNNLAFVAKDENSLWERAIDAKSLSGEYLLVPAPFTASILAGNGVKLTITGDTRLNVLTDSAGINFEYGHIQMEVDQDAIFPVSYMIKTPNGDGTLTFFSPKTKVCLASLCEESQIYAPHLLVFPSDGDSVIWTPGKMKLQMKIDTRSKIVFGAALENSITSMEENGNENNMMPNSEIVGENLKKTGSQLYSRVVSGATLESVLEELLADPDDDAVVLGSRWCAELGRIDIPFKFLSMKHLSPGIHKQLNDYLSEVKLRDPQTVSKLALAEQSVQEH